MTAIAKGAVLGAVQVAMVLSLGAKLLIDRATMPRVWVKTAPYDPNLPIRGRYVSLSLTAEAQGFIPAMVESFSIVPAMLSVEDGKLIARPIDDSSFELVNLHANAPTATLSEPVAYFIPEHANDPSRRPRDEELWVEVTVPPKGPPRPIRLGVKKNGMLTPLDLR
jgi:hypothetical protein